MNSQLEKQVVLLRDKLGQLKIPSRDGELIVICLKPLTNNIALMIPQCTHYVMPGPTTY